MSQEKGDDLHKKFPESAARAKELIASILKEVEWDDFGMGHTELTFEFAVASKIPYSDLPASLVELVEALWRIFGYYSLDGYHYTIAKVPYWDNGFRLSEETLVRTKSRKALHLVNAFDAVLRNIKLLKKRQDRMQEITWLTQQLGRLMEDEQP